MEDNPIRVLLIEDNPGDVRLIQEMLKEGKTASFDVECADRLSTGLERLAEGGIDIVLLDLGLPDSQRVDTFTKVHAEAREVPIVLLTGLDDEVLAAEAVRMGAQDYLVKGQVDGNLLLRAVRYAIERKQAVEMLRETRDYLENLINYASAPIIVWDPNTRIKRFNRAFENLTGYAADEVIGQELPMLFPQDSRDESLSKIAHTLSGEYWESVEIPILRKDGETRLALWNSANIYAEDGSTLLATIAQGTDITELKQNEEKIRHLNLVLRAIRNVNQLIIREKDRDALLKGACDNLIETRGYYNAWIAVLDESGELVTTGEAGLGELFLPIVERLKRGELTHCAARALAQSDVVVTEDPRSACADCPLAARCAGGAAMTIRLEHGGRVFGLTSVSISAHLAAEEEEVSLFREVSNDIAFALHNIELEEERKRTQEALRESEEKYRSLVSNIHDLVMEIDSEGKFTYVSPQIFDMFGYTQEESIGLTALDFVHPDDMERCMKAMETTDEAKHLEYRSRHKDGHYVHVSTSGRMISDGVGGFKIVSVLRDITERKRSEKALQRLMAFNESIVQNAAEGIVVIDAEGYIAFTNPFADALVGYEPEGLVGQHWTLIVPPDQQSVVVAADERRARGESDQYELELVRQDGTTIPVLVSGSPRFEGGRLEGTLAVFTDVTELKRSEEELRRAKNEWESTFDAMSDWVVLMDPETHQILRTNRIAEEITGLPLAEIVGQNCCKLTHGKEQPLAGCPVQTMLDTHDRATAELRMPDSDSWLLITADPVMDDTGKVVGAVHAARDITDRKRAEGEIRSRSEELAALNAVATSVTSTLNLEQVVQIIEERVQTLLGERYPLIFALFDEADEAFQAILTVAGAKLLEKAGKLPGVRLEELSFPLASLHPDARGALLAGKPHVTSDASDLVVGSSIGRKVVQAGQKALGIKCIVALPLWAKGRLMGGMVLLSQREEVSEAQIELLASIGRHAAIAIDNATLYQTAGHEIAERQRAEGALRRSHQGLQTTLGQTVAALAAAVEVRDPYTAGHQHRTADLAVAIAEEMGLPEEQIRGIRMAGSVHDIGKIQIPAEILSKPTRLTEIEWALIQVHPQAGYDILREIDFPWPIARTVLEHHERMDGSGYPQGLSGEDICVEARILAVADVVEAMASHRPYRPAHTIEEALEELRENRGILYDAAAVDACLAVIAAKKFQFRAE